MSQFKINISDGGRAEAGIKGSYSRAGGDCVVRAISHATGLQYTEVAEMIDEFAKRERRGKRKKGISNSQTGVYRVTSRRVMESLGWQWVPTMGIGTGCKVHLRPDELPTDLGPLVVKVTKHLTCVKDGMVWDTYDCTREGTRCVYGYYFNPDHQEPEAVKETSSSWHPPVAADPLGVGLVDDMTDEMVEEIMQVYVNAEDPPLAGSIFDMGVLYAIDIESPTPCREFLSRQGRDMVLRVIEEDKTMEEDDRYFLGEEIAALIWKWRPGAY